MLWVVTNIQFTVLNKRRNAGLVLLRIPSSLCGYLGNNMGLDTVELVIAFEDEFGIAIDNEDAEKIRNPRDVAVYVISRVRTNPDDPCLSQIGFYRIRTILTLIGCRPQLFLSTYFNQWSTQ